MRRSCAILGAFFLLSAPLLLAQESQPALVPPGPAPVPTLTLPSSAVMTPSAMTPAMNPTTTPPATMPAAPAAAAPTAPGTPSAPSAPPPGVPPDALPNMMMGMPPVATVPGAPAPDGANPAPESPTLALPEIPQAPPPAPPAGPETAPAPEKKPMEMPEFAGIAGWLNSEPLTKAQLKGKVVLVDFWTYSCVNCLRTLPYLKDWYKKYKDRGFIIIGVHSPEFEFEKDVNNVKMALQKFGITYPVALDNQMATWAAFQNNVWPAHYFVDADGKVRHIHLGEGEYEESEKMIQKLIMEKDRPKPQPESQPATMPAETKPAESQPAPETKPAPGHKRGRHGQAAAETKPSVPPATPVPPKTPETKPFPLPALSKSAPNVDFSQIKSPETYLGLLRRERLVTSGRPIEMNEWMYDGKWRTEGDRIVLAEGTGKIAFRFNATKVNLVMAPTAGGVQAVIKIDGQPVPADKAGADVKNGTLMITEPRMYELLNLGAQGSEHIIEIEFLNPGAAAYAFTFG